MQCSNNLKQVGLGILNFESQYKTLPRGTYSKRRFTGASAQYGGEIEWPSFLHLILPYLEQQAYFDALGGPNFTKENPWTDPTQWTNTVLNNTSLNALQCPSDFLGDNVIIITSSLKVAKSNYLGIFSGHYDGDSYDNGMYKNCATELRGPFRPYEGVPISDITDGTSQTMAVAEYLKGIDSDDARGDIFTNRAGCKFVYVTTSPNSTMPDSLCSYNAQFCQAGTNHNDPSQNLPCLPAPTPPTSPRRAAGIPAE